MRILFVRCTVVGEATPAPEKAKELVTKEEMEEGDVSFSAYIYFAKAIGYCRFAVTLFFNIVGSTGVTGVVSGFLLAAWTAAIAKAKAEGKSTVELQELSYSYLSYCKF